MAPVDQGPPRGILYYALTTPVSQIELEAGQGEAEAQYALGLVYQYGLHGALKDEAKARDLKQRAMASRGYTPITQYIAGLDGKPGRTAIINVPKHGVPAYKAQSNAACAKALSEARSDLKAQLDCGGAESFRVLQSLWAEATMRKMGR